MNHNYKKFIILWLGECISSIGGGLSSFALSVYIFEKTGSATSMALITLIAFLPSLLLSVPAGVLADRYDRRLLMMIGDGFSALGIVYILVCMYMRILSLVHICVGVGIGSIFIALLEPSYRATISDLLDQEQYSKASGLVGLAGSMRYLISPLLAGFLLHLYGIELILILDICTFFITILCIGFVRKDLDQQMILQKEPILYSLKMGWSVLSEKKGILILVFISSVITFTMGFMQILAEPLVLSFSTSQVLGITETICASGMLVSGLYLGMKGIKKHFLRVLSMSLVIAGCSMMIFGFQQNIGLICLGGFVFFSMLPFANTCLDYIVRTNIEENVQGRVWGLIGFISQMGYVFAYGIAGILADSMAKFLNMSVGRASAKVIMISGLLLVGTAIVLNRIPSIQIVTKESETYE